MLGRREGGTDARAGGGIARGSAARGICDVDGRVMALIDDRGDDDDEGGEELSLRGSRRAVRTPVRWGACEMGEGRMWRMNERRLAKVELWMLWSEGG